MVRRHQGTSKQKTRQDRADARSLSRRIREEKRPVTTKVIKVEGSLSLAEMRRRLNNEEKRKKK